jgi:hypothetical protein
MLSTAATIALVVAGTGVFTLWFLSVLRQLGLRLASLPPEAARHTIGAAAARSGGPEGSPSA